MREPDRLFIFTGAHGRAEQIERTAAAIQSIVRGPVVHLIGDDFSPKADRERLKGLHGIVETADGAALERVVFDLRELGCTRSPNYSTALLYAWELALAEEAEALWVVEADVIPHAGIPEAFREVEDKHHERVGAIAPLYVERGGTRIVSFGGVDDWPEDGEEFAGLRVGMDIGVRKPEPPNIAEIPWAHLACLWFPRITLESQVRPDTDFPFYYVDHDLCEQMLQSGLETVVTDRAVAEHTPGGSSSLRWPNEAKRDRVRESAYEQLCEKWPHLKD